MNSSHAGTAEGPGHAPMVVMALRKTITREQLQRKLKRVAQVRAILTMLSVVPIVMLTGVVFGESMGGAWLVAGFFGGPMVVMALLTRFYCRPAVRCPNCGASLWDLGTGNFKPRRMRVRDDAWCCPKCHTGLV